MTILSAHQLATLANQMIYQVVYSDGTISFVPLDPKNADYVRLQAWLAAGGTLS